MEEEKIYGKLFGSIPLYSEHHLDVLLDTMNKENATHLIIQAVKSAYHQNIYSLGECEVISRCIRVLNREESDEQKKDGE